MGRFSTVDPLPSFVSGRIGIFRDGQKEEEGKENRWGSVGCDGWAGQGDEWASRGQIGNIR